MSLKGFDLIYDGVVQGGGGGPPPPPIDLGKLRPSARIMVSPGFLVDDYLLTYPTITQGLAKANLLVIGGQVPLVEVYSGDYAEDIVINNMVVVDFKDSSHLTGTAVLATPAITVNGLAMIRNLKLALANAKTDGIVLNAGAQLFTFGCKAPYSGTEPTNTLVISEGAGIESFDSNFGGSGAGTYAVVATGNDTAIERNFYRCQLAGFLDHGILKSFFGKAGVTTGNCISFWNCTITGIVELQSLMAASFNTPISEAQLVLADGKGQIIVYDSTDKVFQTVITGGEPWRDTTYALNRMKMSITPDAIIKVSPTFVDSDDLLIYSTITAALVKADALVLLGKIPLIQVFSGVYAEDIVVGSGIAIDFQAGGFLVGTVNPAIPAIELAGISAIIGLNTSFSPKNPYFLIDNGAIFIGVNITAISLNTVVRFDDGSAYQIFNSEFSGVGNPIVSMGDTTGGVHSFTQSLMRHIGGGNLLTVSAGAGEVCELSRSVITGGKLNMISGSRIRVRSGSFLDYAGFSILPDGAAHFIYSPYHEVIITQIEYPPYLPGNPATLRDALISIQGTDTNQDGRIQNLEANMAVVASYLETDGFGAGGQLFDGMITEDYSDESSVDPAKKNNAHVENGTAVFERRELLEDFESYINTAALAAAWVVHQGPAQTIADTLETTYVYAGTKSAALSFLNNFLGSCAPGAGMTRTFPAGPLRDWTDHEFLRFAVRSTDNRVQIQVTLTDNAARTAVSPIINLDAYWKVYEQYYSTWTVNPAFNWSDVRTLDFSYITVPYFAFAGGGGFVYFDEFYNVGNDLWTHGSTIDGFEAAPTDWSVVAGGVTIARDAVRFHQGSASLAVTGGGSCTIGKDFPLGLGLSGDETGFRLWLYIQTVTSAGIFHARIRLYQTGDHSKYVEIENIEPPSISGASGFWVALDFIVSSFAITGDLVQLAGIDRVEIDLAYGATPYEGNFNIDYLEAGQFGKAQSTIIDQDVAYLILLASAQFLESGAHIFKDVGFSGLAPSFPTFDGLCNYSPGNFRNNLWNCPNSTWLDRAQGKRVVVRITAYKRAIVTGWGLTWR